MQTAQKTLGIVAGSILQNTIGKDSQITDAKIQQFIHTQPGIEMEPRWRCNYPLGTGRAQRFVFEHQHEALNAMRGE